MYSFFTFLFFSHDKKNPETDFYLICMVLFLFFIGLYFIFIYFFTIIFIIEKNKWQMRNS